MLGFLPLESSLEYVWFGLIGLGVGLIAGRFLQGNNFGVTGDIAFGIGGALAFGVAVGVAGVAPGVGLGGKVAMAGMGAMLALFLRRVLRSV